MGILHQIEINTTKRCTNNKLICIISEYKLGEVMDLRKSIKIALAKKNISASDLAVLLGVSRQRLSNIMAASNVRSDTIDNIAEALDMQASELIALGEDE